MYTLTLTSSERKAFDWVGHRYAAGYIRTILSECLPEDSAWDDEGDITFQIPEHKAWMIDAQAKGEGYAFPCFADDLARKMISFCRSIV